MELAQAAESLNDEYASLVLSSEQLSRRPYCLLPPAPEEEGWVDWLPCDVEPSEEVLYGPEGEWFMYR